MTDAFFALLILLLLLIGYDYVDNDIKTDESVLIEKYDNWIVVDKWTFLDINKVIIEKVKQFENDSTMYHSFYCYDILFEKYQLGYIIGSKPEFKPVSTSKIEIDNEDVWGEDTWK